MIVVQDGVLIQVDYLLLSERLSELPDGVHAILKLIEVRFGLCPLGERDKNSKDMTAAFDFSGPPAEPVCKP